MRLTQITDKGIALVPIMLGLCVFFIPVSPSLKSIFFVCSLVLVLLTPYYNQYIFSAYKTSWGYTALALFIFILIAVLWSPAPFAGRWSVLGKYDKLLTLPILTAGFINPRCRNWTIKAYLAAIGLTCVLAVLKVKGLVDIGQKEDQGSIFYNHIITGLMVGFGSYLAGLMVFQIKGWGKSIYFCLWLLTSYQVLFINTGRTGYLMYVLLMILLIVQKLSLKHIMVALLVFFSVFGLCYKHSQVMQFTIGGIFVDLKSIKQNQINNSLGYRMQFHSYAKSLFVQHPFVGIGTGGFKYSFYQDNPVPAWGKEITEPHSQYWMTLAEQGLIGLALLLAFLTSIFITSLQLKETRPILLGSLLVFCLASFTDTILCYSTQGYLLIMMSALCFGELLEKKCNSSGCG